MPSPTVFLRISTVLWVIWGLVHMLAGILIIPVDAGAGFAAIADDVPTEALEADYHPAVGAILNQHAWNLMWGGAATIVGGLFIWRSNTTAIWVTAMIGGLLDLGYFMFLDLGGYVKFIPGSLMTYVSGSAIILSFFAWRQMRAQSSEKPAEQSA